MSATLIKTLNSETSINAIYDGNNLLFFLERQKIYRSDGTENGTFEVLEELSNVELDFSNFATINGAFLFANSDNQNGQELWVSDGTTTGTRILKDINPVGPSRPRSFVSTNNLLFFTAFEENNGRALYVSDGTEAGTKLIKDLINDPLNISGGLFGEFSDGDINGTIFFEGGNVRQDSSIERGLWKSDGTEVGTQFIRGFETFGGVKITNLTVGDNLLYFTIPFPSQSSDQQQLWRSDGTTEGTVLLKEDLTFTDELVTVGDTVFFSNFDVSSGAELWKSDGTEESTVLVKDIRAEERQNGVPINRGSDPDNFFNVNGTLFFTADDGIHGEELWKSDGTEEGTVLVKDITEGSDSTNIEKFRVRVNSDRPNVDSGSFTEFNGVLYFIVGSDFSAEPSFSLYKSDGTENGTVEIISEEGIVSRDRILVEPSQLIGFQGNLFFNGKTFVPNPAGSSSTGQGFTALYKLDESDQGNTGGGDPLLNTTLNRFRNKFVSGTYLFATDEESESIIRDFSDTFELEGAAFKVSNQPGDDLVKFNRFRNKKIAGTYLFATEDESESIIRDFSDTFELEGTAFYAYGADANKGTDYYRLANTQVAGTYLFVDEQEKDSALTQFPDLFRNEGIAFEVG